MAAKEKRHTQTPPLKKAQPATTRPPLLAKGNVLPAALLCLFVAVEFFPNMDTADNMGPQWLYLVIINFIVTGYMLFDKKNNYYAPVKRITSSVLSIFYVGLFLVAGISILSALNKTESIVCYARITTSLVTYFNIALLLYGRLDMFRFFAQLFTLILLIKAIGVLIEFSNGYGNTNLDLLVYNLKGNTGNKNVMAASLVMKIPFAVYCIYSFRGLAKLINFVILLLAALAIFIINARASYLSLGFELLIFIIFCILIYFKDKNRRSALTSIGLVILPIVISFFLSQSILNKAMNLEDNQGSIGTVTERLGTISFTAEGSGNRILEWSAAWDYIKHHPWKGAGYGNWKLVSIPYEKEYVNDMRVTAHVHNDFLEVTAETGIIGGLLFFAIFLCATVYFLKAIFSVRNPAMRNIAVFSLMLLAAYAIDATFNFPMERPVMQLFFIFCLGLCVNIFLSLKTQQQGVVVKRGRIHLLFFALLLLLLTPAFYVTMLTCRSLVAQYRCFNDMESGEFKYSSDEVIASFPKIPNLNYLCVPIDGTKALYLTKEKKYKEALALLDQSMNVNPYLTYHEYQKANIFLETNQLDSSFYYAYKAFYAKPRARSNWQMLNIVSSRLNDTGTISKSFIEYTRYRNEAWAWNQYLSTILYLPYNKGVKQAWADSALKLFPDDILLKQKRELLFHGPKISKPIQPNEEKEARDYYNLALESFNKKDFTGAAQKFIRSAELNPNNYLPVENTGLCFYSLKNYREAMTYFDRVLQNYEPNNGKSELFKGLCLIFLGNKKEGCNYLKKSDSLNYQGAKIQINQFCQ